MAGLALPKLRWLLAGGLATGIWVVSQEKDVPRPPERVPVLKSVVAAPSRPAITLPRRVERPPPRPEKIVTGSISKPYRPRILRTTTAVNLRQRADVGSAVLMTLAGGSRVREIARSGKWRLVTIDGSKGWVHANYLDASHGKPRRPKLPVLGSSTKPAKPAVEKKP